MVICFPASSAEVRLKDLVDFGGVRGNDLVGYGLVVGLDGTGDGIRNSPFTEELLSSVLERFGINVSGEQFRPRNVAAVIVTAVLPPFARAGGRLDATVSAIGDAKSLLGGTLIMTPLSGADGHTYAVAQGSIIAGGISADGDAGRIVHGVPTTGTIVSGARIEREVDFDLSSLSEIVLALRDPDFSTAAQIERVINEFYRTTVARMIDSGTVILNLQLSNSTSPAHALSSIEQLSVSPQTAARVVVDQRSGTIVLGNSVTISPVAVAQGNLTLTIEESPIAIQPSPFSDGETIVVPRTSIQIEQEIGNGFAEVPEATSLSEVVKGLNALGVPPLDMIDILKSIKAAGAMHAEFIVR